MTEAGRTELLRWLELPPKRAELRDESLLKLFFADLLAVEQAIEQLRWRRLDQEGFLAFLRQVAAQSDAISPPFVDLVLRYGIAYAEFNVAWCEEQEASLGKGVGEAA